jgi:steroid delta-isomerase-like uncharacterized protein
MPVTDVRKTEGLVELTHDLINAFNRGDWDLMRGMLAPDALYEEFGTQRKAHGPEKIIEIYASWKQAFPDAAGEVKRSLASGNDTALEVIWTGTHSGPLVSPEGTIPASGKVQKTPGCIFCTFDGDKVTSMRQYFDSLTLLQQIGAQP